MAMTEWAARAVVKLVSAYLKKELPRENWNVEIIDRANSLVSVSADGSGLLGVAPTAFRWPVDSKTLRNGVMGHMQEMHGRLEAGRRRIGVVAAETVCVSPAPVVPNKAQDSSYVACVKSSVADAAKHRHLMRSPGTASHNTDTQAPYCREVKKIAGLQVAGKRTTGVNRWVELDIEGSDLSFEWRDELRLTEEMAGTGDRLRAAYARSCSDSPWSRQGLFLGDDLDMTFSDVKNGLSFFGTDRSGHSGRVHHAR